jgi:hypothetical protein
LLVVLAALTGPPLHRALPARACWVVENALLTPELPPRTERMPVGLARHRRRALTARQPRAVHLPAQIGQVAQRGGFGGPVRLEIPIGETVLTALITTGGHARAGL